MVSTNYERTVRQDKKTCLVDWQLAAVEFVGVAISFSVMVVSKGALVLWEHPRGARGDNH